MTSHVVCFFFFSSRRRHTRYWRDWSSDVCSSDLEHGRVRVWDAVVLGAVLGDELRPARGGGARPGGDVGRVAGGAGEDRKSVVEGKSGDLGGRRIIKKKNQPHSTDVRDTDIRTSD